MWRRDACSGKIIFVLFVTKNFLKQQATTNPHATSKHFRKTLFQVTLAKYSLCTLCMMLLQDILALLVRNYCIPRMADTFATPNTFLYTLTRHLCTVPSFMSGHESKRQKVFKRSPNAFARHTCKTMLQSIYIARHCCSTLLSDTATRHSGMALLRDTPERYPRDS